MSAILIYLKKLHAFAGWKLYFNIIGMMLIGFVETMSIFLIIPLLSLIGVFKLEASIPLLGPIVNALQGTSIEFNLPLILILYLGLMLGQAWLSRNQTVMNIQIQQGFIRHLRIETYRSLLQAQWSFFLRKRKSDFQHILTSELARVSQGTHLSLNILASIVFTAVQVGFAFWLSAPLTLLVLAGGLTLVLLSRRFLRNARSIGENTSELTQSYFAGITDQMNGIKDIKSNSLEASYNEWFRSLCMQISDNIVRFVKLQAASKFYYKAASAIMITVFIYLSFEVFTVQAEQLMLIVVIFARLWPRFTSIQSSSEQLAQSIPAFHTLIDLNQECSLAEEAAVMRRTAKPMEIERGIECKHLYYRYPGESNDTLKDITISVPANQMTAIVGKSGAGKSTLVDLIMGLIQPNEGQVLVDGKQLSEDDIVAYRSSIGYVSQDPFLFHTSIRENLQLVKPEATDQEMWSALRFSSAEEVVKALPKGLDTIIGDRGIRLSGGERQRIVLARAILRTPALLILDEATSALDTENENKIQQALEQLKGTMTIIVIAHRLSTIRNADQVLVLENGEVVEYGGFQQLAHKEKGTFQRLLQQQV
ncbi:ABC transporter ATP-binding protein [Paenibacillus turpanensis]|uniref:ABC transporter ATP-binding protein n=1 Tax=Paenibacillus turpanensis TaxID=2689078 RepID=UPI00140739EC|nr:ABC transporter ATP-binding protein [Paenibacillus turpanensis]